MTRGHASIRPAADVVDELRSSSCSAALIAPHPLATTPRSTSFVPPRRVNNGECSRAVAKQAAQQAVDPSSRDQRSRSARRPVPPTLLEPGAEILDQRGTAARPRRRTVRGPPTPTAGAARSSGRSGRRPRRPSGRRRPLGKRPSRRRKSSVAVDRSVPARCVRSPARRSPGASRCRPRRARRYRQRRRRRTSTSLKWCSPVISSIGLIVTPAASVGTMNWLKPAWRCGGSSGPVRASTTIWCATCAPLVHTLVPVSSQPPSVATARVWTAARSEPAPCSLIPIAEYSSPRRSGAGADAAAPRCRGEQTGCHLAVGDPMCGDGRSVREQFLGHDVAMQVTEAVAAVSGGDGEADEAGVGQPRGELRIPLRQPAVDGRLPAEGGAISRQKVPDRRPQRGQSPVVGAQGIEFTHWVSSLLTGRVVVGADAVSARRRGCRSDARIPLT